MLWLRGSFTWASPITLLLQNWTIVLETLWNLRSQFVLMDLTVVNKSNSFINTRMGKSQERVKALFPTRWEFLNDY